MQMCKCNGAREEMAMGTYVMTVKLSPQFREAHFQALKAGSKLPEELAIPQKAHLDYVNALKAKGKLLIGGPVVAFTWALQILRVDSLEEARMLAENDPAVKAGLFTDVNVEPWYHMS